MTHSTAEKIADVAIGTAVAVAAYYVVTTPSLRRLAWRLTLVGLSGTLPAWLRREIEQGWEQSGRTQRDQQDAMSEGVTAGTANR
jgi:hypothetical protein